ncbi:MAG: hypothetical protein IT497_07095, partial [Ottowia sp.]|nr:hypothetical protein [Ottowia sp.]
SYAIGGLRGLASAVGGGASGVLAKLGGYIGSAARAVLLLGRALMLSPLGIVLTLASAAYLIWKNWDAVSLAVGNFFAKLPYWAGFAVGSVINGFKQLGQMIGDVFARSWQACSAWGAKMGELVCTAVDGMTAYFKTLPQRVWASIKSLGSLLAKIWDEPYAAIDRFVEAIKAKMMGIVNAVKDIISGISQVFKKLGGDAVSEVMNGYQVGVNGVPSKSSLLSHPAVAQSISARQDLKGEMTVRFEGAPQGMRVEPGRTNQSGMSFNPDVGYRFASVG